MIATEKYTPDDSEGNGQKQDQAVTDKRKNISGGKEAKTSNPAKKRKYSENPPTKRNAKT